MTRSIKVFFKYLLYCVFTSVIVISFLRPMLVLANGPRAASDFHFEVINYPENAVYIDLLIPLGSDDKNYVEFNEKKASEYEISRSSEIVSYNKDGFISYSFHFVNSSSKMVLKDNPSYNQFAFDNYEDFNYIYTKCRKIKLALLDSNGNIIKVTSKYTINKGGDSYLVDGFITYDAQNNKLEGISTRNNSAMVIFLIFVIASYWIFPLLITLLTEGILAKLFLFNKINKIVMMNLVTNLGLFIFMTYLQSCGISYLKSLILGELLVYSIEFILLELWYYRFITIIRILIYTLIANTTSLLFTLLFHSIFGGYL